jgi:branched-chain amino acid transport system permease protein
MVKYHGGSMDDGARCCRPVFAGLGALIFGWFCVRLSGVYMAMLTLAAAQIVWSTAYQWQEVTGGDDGLLGIWPSEWAKSKRRSTIWRWPCASAASAAQADDLSPFGYTCAAGATARNRTESIGINLQSPAMAGLRHRRRVRGAWPAGSTCSPRARSSPMKLAIPRSVDALVMVLLGGVQTLSGPIVGAGVFRLLEDAISG